MTAKEFQPGDWIIYRMQKRSLSPGPRAANVLPDSKGDAYHYTVDKYWVVESIVDENHIRICTRRGKRHLIAVDDERLHRANWWQRWWYRERFEAIDLTQPVPAE